MLTAAIGLWSRHQSRDGRSYVTAKLQMLQMFTAGWILPFLFNRLPCR